MAKIVQQKKYQQGGFASFATLAGLAARRQKREKPNDHCQNIEVYSVNAENV